MSEPTKQNVIIGVCKHPNTYPFHNTTNGEKGDYCYDCGTKIVDGQDLNLTLVQARTLAKQITGAIELAMSNEAKVPSWAEWGDPIKAAAPPSGARQEGEQPPLDTWSKSDRAQFAVVNRNHPGWDRIDYAMALEQRECQLRESLAANDEKSATISSLGQDLYAKVEECKALQEKLERVGKCGDNENPR